MKLKKLKLKEDLKGYHGGNCRLDASHLCAVIHYYGKPSDAYYGILGFRLFRGLK